MTRAVGLAAPEVLRFEGLEMTFGATRALRGVDLDIRGGEIHGLLGQNGSGKSTLIKVLAGFHAPVAGRLFMSGHELQLPVTSNDRAAQRLAFVHQDLGLMPGLSVAENFQTTKWSTAPAFTRVAWRKTYRQVTRLLADYGVNLDPRSLVRDLTPVERALLAIVRAVDAMNPEADGARPADPGLLVLDEPTVFLGGPDATRLYDLMRRVAAEGSGVLFVSHDIDEVKRITDRVTVLRDGSNVGTRTTDDVTVGQIVEMVIGETAQRAMSQVVTADVAAADHKAGRDAPVSLTVRALATTRLREATFEARLGTIVGLTGLPGSGFEDVLYALYGARAAAAGEIELDQTVISLADLSPTRAKSLGFAFVPSDRLTEGCVPHLTVTENNGLVALDAFRRGPVLSRRLARRLVSRQIREYDVRVSGPDAAYSTMSGGNQQKALLAKWLFSKPRVVLLSQPTQGVDIGARAEIWHLLRAQRAGRFTLCASLDHDELVTLCDSVIVFNRGEIVATLRGSELTETNIARLCVAGGTHE